MSAFMYDIARQKFGNAQLSWTGMDIKLVAVDTGNYTVNMVTDEFLDSITAIARIGTTGNLQNKTNVFGVFDADDITIPTVTGASIEAAVIYRDTGNEATSELLLYIDSGAGFPIVPNGTDILWLFDNGATKIAKL